MGASFVLYLQTVLAAIAGKMTLALSYHNFSIPFHSPRKLASMKLGQVTEGQGFPRQTMSDQKIKVNSLFHETFPSKNAQTLQVNGTDLCHDRL